MQTLLVEIKSHAGLKILQELEQANLIRLIPAKDDKPQKLSARLRGAISKETARQMQAELEQMRSEWLQRDI
jgi:Holliday junction resolvasome RuvABC DNA-binding subunit